MADASPEHVAKAKQLIGERRYQDAVRALRRALVSRPDDVDARVLLGQVLLALERWEEARAEMMALARRAPKLAAAQRLLGEAFLRSGKVEKAAEALKKALALDVNDDAARELLAETGEEPPPRSETLERWFDPEQVATVQTRPPDFVEDTTGSVPLPSEPTALSAPPTSLVALPTTPTAPTPRKPKATIVGMPTPLSGASMRKPVATIVGLASPLAAPPVTIPKPRTPKATLIGIPAPRPAPIAPPSTLPAMGPTSAAADEEGTTNVLDRLPDTSAPTVPASPEQMLPLRIASRGGKAPSVPPPPPTQAAGSPKSMPPPPPGAPPGTHHAPTHVAGSPKSIPPPSPSTAPLATGATEITSATPVGLGAPKSVAPPPPPGLGARPPTRPLALSPPRMPGKLGPPPSTGTKGIAAKPGGAPGAPKSVAPPPPPAREVTAPLDLTDIEPGVRRSEATVPLDLDDILVAPSRRVSEATVPLDLDEVVTLPPVPGASFTGPTPTTSPQLQVPMVPPRRGGVATPFPDEPTRARGPATPSPDAPMMPDFAPAELAAARALTPPDVDSEVVTRDRIATPETRPKRSPVVLAAVAGVALLVLGGGGLGVRAYVRHKHAANITAAVAQFERDGRPASLDAAVDVARRDGDQGDPAVQALLARLAATATLEQGRTLPGAATTAPSPEAAALRDGQIAATYLALARGDAPAAARAASLVTGVEGAEAAEGARARALAAVANGSVERALAEARSAERLRLGGSRATVLVALLTAHGGDIGTALALLDRAPDASQSPDVHALRARLLAMRGTPDDLVQARAEITAVLGAFAAHTTTPERSWAHLASAMLARATRDPVAALADARAATPAPPGDVDFVVEHAAVLTDAGAPADALRELAALPATAGNVVQRSLVTARAALATGDLATADQSLASAGTGGEPDLLRGRVAEARGDVTRASALYTQIPDTAPEMVAARTRRAAISLARGNAREAAALVAPALARAPTDADAATIAVRARLALHDTVGAEAAIAPALAVQPGSPPLLAVRAELELARGDAAAAVATLGAAIAQAPRDVTLRLALGDAQRRARQPDAAHATFEQLLTLSPENPRALVALADLAIDAGDVAAATALLDRADHTGQATADVARRRPLLAVVQGAGASAVAQLEPLATAGNDAGLWDALGRLQVQAENDSAAIAAFGRALALDGQDPEAFLGRATAEAHKDDTRSASRDLTAATRAATDRGSPPSLFARIDALRARLRTVTGDLGNAVDLAHQALEKDPRCAEAHLVLALVALEQSHDPTEELRAATQGNAPPAEALGRLAHQLRTGPDACALATRYVLVAPEGFDIDDVHDVLADCH